MKFVTLDQLLRFLILALIPIALIIGLANHSHFGIQASTGRKPLVLIQGQTTQLPDTDYVTSIGGGSFNGAPAAPGDIELTTINGHPPSSVTGTFPIVVTNDAGVFNVAEQIDPSGSLTITDAGLALKLDPDGGLEIDDAGSLNIKSTLNLQNLKFNDVLVMGRPDPGQPGPTVYASDGGVSVVQITGISSLSINLTAEGTTDWMAPLTTSFLINRKANVGSTFGSRLTPPEYVFGGCVAGSASTASGGAGSTPYTINWDPSDSTAAGASSGSTVPGNFALCSDNPGSGLGLLFVVQAKPYPQVFRQYMQIGQNTIPAFECKGTLSDGSGSATSPSISTTNTYFKETWTFHSSVIGAYLEILCHVTTPFSGSGGIAVVWYAMTLALL